MFTVNFTVKPNMSNLSAKVSKIKTNNTLGTFAASEAARLMQPYVPEREGVLKNAVTRPWEIIYTVPYAAYQYYGTHLQHTKPTAVPYWDKQLNKNALAIVIEAFVKSRGF